LEAPVPCVVGADDDDVMLTTPEGRLDPEATIAGDEVIPVRDRVLVMPMLPLVGAEPGSDVVSLRPAVVVVFVKGYGAEDSLPPKLDDVKPLLGGRGPLLPVPVIDELTGEEDGAALPDSAGLLVGYEVEVEDGSVAVTETLPLVPNALVGAVPGLVVVG